MLVISRINCGNLKNCPHEPDLEEERYVSQGSSPRYSSDDLLRRSSSGLVRCLLLVFPLSSRDYLALHLSAALLDYRPSRSTQFRMTRIPTSLSLFLSYRFLVRLSYFFLRVRVMMHRSIDLRVVIFTLVCSAETMFRGEENDLCANHWIWINKPSFRSLIYWIISRYLANLYLIARLNLKRYPIDVL